MKKVKNTNNFTPISNISITDFLAHFQILFAPSYTLWVTPQDFPKWKALSRYISEVSFISIAIWLWNYKFSKFLVLIQHSRNGPILGFFGSFFHKYCFILLKFWPDIFSNKTSTVFQNHSKFWILAVMECTQSLHFWSIVGPNLLLRNQKYY